MRRALVSVVVAALGVGAVVCTSSDAHALGPLDLEVGLKGGVGTNPISGSDVNVLGAGLGARAGVSIFGFYGGIQGMYYLGGSTDVPVGNGATVSTSYHTTLLGIEAGYSIKIPLVPLTIRPQIGVGNATVSASADGLSSSNSNLYLEPGVTALIGLGLFYVGADVNYLILPGLGNSSSSSATDGALTIHGQIGVKF